MHRLFIKLYITQLTLEIAESRNLEILVWFVVAVFLSLCCAKWFHSISSYKFRDGLRQVSSIENCGLFDTYQLLFYLSHSPPLSPPHSFLFLPYFMLIYLFIKYSRWFVVIFSAKYLFVFLLSSLMFVE